MTWAGERCEQLRSFQSPGLFFLLTLPFIERAYRTGPGTQVTGKLTRTYRVRCMIHTYRFASSLLGFEDLQRQFRVRHSLA